ncbi:glutamate racemase [Litorimonas sp. WD9-15]|uniref:glutamate racemase n=1 Tax=Litorimonas sp. WD9-15 TaxID=3418716 RepID=UPI003D025844
MSHHVLVFDSGVGGLSVVAEIRKRLPGVHLSYAADDEFRPYGNKTENQLRRRLPGLLQTLVLMLNPDVVVVACNTASTIALEAIRDVIDIPVIGVVPAIKPAAESSRMGAIGVLGTPGTVKQKYVDALIADFAADCRVVLQGSTRLVVQAEQKLAGKDVDMDVIRAEVAPIFAGRTGMDIDAVVLACTHFPLLRDELKQAVRQSVQWIDSGEAIARRLEDVLKNISEAGAPPYPQTAFLIGPDTDPIRGQAFATYGFPRTIGLMRDE